MKTYSMLTAELSPLAILFEFYMTYCPLVLEKFKEQGLFRESSDEPVCFVALIDASTRQAERVIPELVSSGILWI